MGKRILILTDSLGLPRDMPEQCTYEDTWPVILKNNGYNTHQVSIGGATTKDIIRQLPYHKSFNPDLVIVEIGIVDCAPRFLTQLEVEILRKIPYLGLKIIKILNRKWIKKIRKVTYVSQSRFKKNINYISSYFNVPVIFVGIVPASDGYEKKLPGIIKNVLTYNKILEKKENYISIKDIPLEGVMSDYIHLNALGHGFVSSLIFNMLHDIDLDD